MPNPRSCTCWINQIRSVLSSGTALCTSRISLPETKVTTAQGPRIKKPNHSTTNAPQPIRRMSLNSFNSRLLLSQQELLQIAPLQPSVAQNQTVHLGQESSLKG